MKNFVKFHHIDPTEAQETYFKLSDHFIKTYEKTIEEAEEVLVVGIGRSGIPLAITVHNRLGLAFSKKTIKIEYLNVSSFSGGEDITKCEESLRRLRNNITSEKCFVVVCDGIIDSGKTIESVNVLISEHFKVLDLVNIVHIINYGCFPRFKTFVALKLNLKDTWVIQPYEKG